MDVADMTGEPQAAPNRRRFPRQFWVLTAGIFVYVGAAALAFPFEAIYLRTELGASMSAIGWLFGFVPIVFMPLQIWAGHLTDRVGRRWLIILAAGTGIAWFTGFAFADAVWQVAVLVAVETALGWPLFQTASNAMIADLVDEEHRADAYGVTRIAMNVGVVLGPAVAGVAIAGGVSYRQLFLAAAAGCLAFVLAAVMWIHETRPPGADTDATDAEGRSGYGIVLADRRFLRFCLVALLPVFAIGTFVSIFSVFATDHLGISSGTWGLLLALNAFLVATLQLPLIRATRRVDPMLLLALSSLLLGLGIGAAAFVTPLWPIVALVVVVSVGEVFLSPVASTVVAEMAPEEIRGRYMGVWTLVWSGGAGLGPWVIGYAIDVFGGRAAFTLIAVAGVAGALLFPLLRDRERRSPPAPAVD